LLVFINGIMMVGRLFAGPIVHRIAPSGILLASAVLAAIGLLWLSYANGGEAYAAAGVFALGICFFWPTMLGFVSENLPKTGAVGLSLMGGAGMFSLTLTLPVVGAIMQNAANAAGGADVGAITLRYLAVLPGILIVLFAGLMVYMRGRKAEHIAPPTTKATASVTY
jgi:MFS family permease